MARAALLLVLLLLPWPATASEWGGIEPGVTTLQKVRERYGEPSRENQVKVETYNTVQWVYESGRAPAGIAKMIVDFGLLTPAGYQAELVRILRLEPKPQIFGRATVVQGWGIPDGLGETKDGTVSMFWKEGLIVTLDRDGENAVLMTFSPPQPELPIQDPPAAAPSAPPKLGAPVPQR